MVNVVELLEVRLIIKWLDVEVVKDFWNKVDELLCSVIDLSFDVVIKKYIIYYLCKILVLIEEYKIIGVLLILDVVELMIGYVYFDEIYCDVLKDIDVGRDIFIIFVVVVNIVMVVVGLL